MTEHESTTATEIAEPENSSPESSGPQSVPPLELGSPDLYFNRELSWLQFNSRVLEEALDPKKPLLERVRFLSIFSRNLDEFFMIRISGLRRQLEVGVVNSPPDGMTPGEQIQQVHRALSPVLKTAVRCFRKELLPALEEGGVRLQTLESLTNKEREKLRRYFTSEIFKVLTPLAFDPGHPFPHISNLSLNLAVVVRDGETGERFARVKVPKNVPRFVRVPEKGDVQLGSGLGRFVLLEELILANLDLLFPEVHVEAAYPFRVTRDADFEIEIDEASDLLTVVAEGVERRQFGKVVRLQVDDTMPERVLRILEQNLRLQPYQVFRQKGVLGLADLDQLADLDVPSQRYRPFTPGSSALFSEEDPFPKIRGQDVLLYHPYQSFTPVIDFIRKAARDPHVVAIKQTLYRVGPNSPIVEALLLARENGKQVSVLVELKARFDEENNIGWARALEKAGVHVVYGLLGLKTHCKMCLVVRREPDTGHLESYVHLGTGNYNPTSARIYTDIGLFTRNAEIADDVSDLFNALTGYSRKTDYRTLLVSPHSLRQGILDRIEREVEHQAQSGSGVIVFKLNSLVDRSCIDALYRASQAGVRIELQVRGICCLKPGLPGVSENIRVTSIVGRFLEHSRIYYFGNGGDEEILIGSADLMPRNLDGRIELLVPILDADAASAIRRALFLHLADNVSSRVLSPDGSYLRCERPDGILAIDSQVTMLRAGGMLEEEDGNWEQEVRPDLSPGDTHQESKR